MDNLTKVEVSILQRLKERGAQSCTEIGEYLWGNRCRNRQSYARPAGKILKRLASCGYIAPLTTRTINHSRNLYMIRTLGERVLVCGEDAGEGE